jgi:hypothetical protein
VYLKLALSLQFWNFLVNVVMSDTCFLFCALCFFLLFFLRLFAPTRDCVIVAGAVFTDGVRSHFLTTPVCVHTVDW